MVDQVSELTIKQRIRNRIIEYFAIFGDPLKIKDYQEKAPVCVFSELIEQWQDWFELDPVTFLLDFSDPPFSYEEQNVLLAFNQVWEEHALDVWSEYEDVHEYINSKDYDKFSSECKLALGVFMKKGLLEED